MPESRFHTIANHRQSHMVVERATGRCLGAVAVTHYRPFVFPLYSPRGHTVVEACPPDHPFHNGFFVAQGAVVAGGREGNFWATPPRTSNHDHVQHNMGRMETRAIESEAHDDGVRFVLDCVWVDENDEPMLDETRTIDLYVDADATVCDMVSTKVASYGPLVYPQTKHGSVGLRVEQRLLPALGGVVIADRGRRGLAEVVHEQESGYVAYESELDGQGTVGVLMTVLHDDVPGVWFVRDYGMAMYDSTLRQEIVSAEGESWSVGVRIAAYDGPLDDERAGRWTVNGVLSQPKGGST